MKKAAVLVAFVGCLTVFGCGPSAMTEESVLAADRSGAQMAPGLTLKDADGQEVSLESLRGKVVLLNFWATWCAPCKIEMPWFVDFQRKYKDKGFSVVAVSMDEEGWEIVRPYTQQMDLNFPVLLGDDAVAESFGGIDALPTTFIIDREGRIAATHMGLVSRDEYEGQIEDLL